MPVLVGSTALAPVDFGGLVDKYARFLRDSRSVLRPSCPAQAITADVDSLGPLQGLQVPLELPLLMRLVPCDRRRDRDRPTSAADSVRTRPCVGG